VLSAVLPRRSHGDKRSRLTGGAIGPAQSGWAAHGDDHRFSDAEGEYRSAVGLSRQRALFSTSFAAHHRRMGVPFATTAVTENATRRPTPPSSPGAPSSVNCTSALPDSATVAPVAKSMNTSAAS
jgi:hypothetical protein